MVAVSRFLMVCAALLVLPAILCTPLQALEEQFPLPGWYYNGLGIIQDTSGELSEESGVRFYGEPGTIQDTSEILYEGNSGISVSWQDSYVYDHPGEVPLYWYVELVYYNNGTSSESVGCTGGDSDQIKEHIRGTANSGTVVSDDNICIRDPNFRVILNPGESVVVWAIFHNVPWNNSEVALEFPHVYPGDTLVVVSPYVNPWYSAFDDVPPAVCPPELVALGVCEPGEGS
jgi:hypothetical protein